MGNHLSRALAYEQRTLRAAIEAAGIAMRRDAAVRIVAELHATGHEVAPFTPEAIEARSREVWTDPAAPSSSQAGD